MSPHSHPPSNLFFSRSIAPTLKICKQIYLVKFRKNPFSHKQTQKESIKHTLQINIQEKFTKIIKKIMQAYLPQLPQSEKPTTSTLPNFLPKLPSKSPKPPNASSFPLKRQRVYRQTSKRFKQNVKEFSSKRKGVSDKTQGRFSILIFL